MGIVIMANSMPFVSSIDRDIISYIKIYRKLKSVPIPKGVEWNLKLPDDRHVTLVFAIILILYFHLPLSPIVMNSLSLF